MTLEEMARRIETLEAEQEQLHQRFAEPGFYQQSGAEIAKVTTRLETVHQELQTAYARWESLEAVAAWGRHAEHLLAQRSGRQKWYQRYTLRVCRVEHVREFSRGTG